ncbi:MAG: hypothetical protein IPO49_15860 [Bacteroidetes bacterium]|nr:hypothetical protein [Bacteroidota bacterium]
MVTRPRYDWLKPVKQVKRRNDKNIIFHIPKVVAVCRFVWVVGGGAVGAKLNVVQKRLACLGWLAPLLILQGSVGIVSFILELFFYCLHCRHRVACNEEGIKSKKRRGLEAQTVRFAYTVY